MRSWSNIWSNHPIFLDLCIRLRPEQGYLTHHCPLVLGAQTINSKIWPSFLSSLMKILPSDTLKIYGATLYLDNKPHVHLVDSNSLQDRRDAYTCLNLPQKYQAYSGLSREVLSETAVNSCRHASNHQTSGIVSSWVYRLGEMVQPTFERLSHMNLSEIQICVHIQEWNTRASILTPLWQIMIIDKWHRIMMHQLSSSFCNH